MKRTVFVIALALALTFALTASAFATTGKFFTNGTSYYKWAGGSRNADAWNGSTSQNVNGAPITIDGTTYTPRLPATLSTAGDNPTNPGAHANYLASTAKCGMCHSVHRATAGGTKLLPTADATCAGCHTGSTTITAKIITWATLNMAWREGSTEEAGGGGGPHNDGLDTLFEDGYWDGVSTPPPPSYAHGARYGCFTRRCHATNPHGAGGSKYKIFAAKLLFNNTPAQDDVTYGAPAGTSTYGGDDAVYNALGATDAAVKRFADANPGIITLDDANGLVLINGEQPDPAETHALVAGLTCGRPSNFNEETGADECHAEASYAIVDKGIVENRNHGTGYTSPGAIRTDNTGAELPNMGGNDNRDAKTGHVAGSFVAGNSEYAPIAGCTSCHDQTDAGNTVAGNFTFPHGQTPTGVTNAVAYDGSSGIGLRSRIWSGWSGFFGDQAYITADSSAKAYDGQCLKCHRDNTGSGVGLTY